MATQLDKARGQVALALRLCDSGTADGLIGSPPPEEYETLEKAAKAIYQMLWMLAKGNGMKQTPEVLKMGAEALLVLATIVHYAYALGVKRGRESR